MRFRATDLPIGTSPPSGARLESLFAHTPDIIVLLDAHGVVREISASVRRLLGYDPEELVGGSGCVLLDPDERPRVHELFAELLVQPAAVRSIQLCGPNRAGQTRYFEAVFTNLLHEPNLQRVVVNAHDISRHRQVELDLQQIASRDPLTGLPNRTEFMRRLEVATAHEPADRPCVAVLFVDLDRFKTINDTFGHAVGDLLLTQVSTRLAAALRGDDLLARYGGDEFVILAERVPDSHAAHQVAERVIDALRPPFLLNGREVIVSASVGVSVGRDAEVTARGLLRQADVALYQAKKQGRASYIEYAAAHDAPMMQLLQMETDLWQALERQELRLLYQPLVDLATRQTVGFEALVRWQHPERGLLLPEAFIPFAEQSGLINAIGGWVLSEACPAGSGLAPL